MATIVQQTNGEKTIYKADEYTSVLQKFSDVNEQLADIANLVTNNGADKTGVNPSATAINQAIANASAGDEILFPTGTYLIDSPINWNKKVKLKAVGIVTLKATATMNAIINCTAFTSYEDVDLDGFVLDSNNLSNYGLLLDGSASGSYNNRLTVKNTDALNAVLDGINITGSAWNINFKNVQANNNGRDGLRGIVTDATKGYQINHITIDDDCIFNNNVNAGVNLMGSNITIGKIDTESNKYGILVDMSQTTTGSYVGNDINIKNSYIEGNNQAQVYLKATAGEQISVTLESAYLNNNSSASGVGTSLITCIGPSESISLSLKSNNYTIGGSITTILDGGNALTSKSIIDGGVHNNESEFINLGLARILWDYYKSIPLPATTCFGVTPKSTYETNNLISSNKTIIFPINVDITEKLPHGIYATINTDCTAYNITCYINELDITTGAQTKSTSFTITGTASQSWGAYIVNNWGYYRPPSGKTLMVEFVLNSYTGTTLTIANTYLQVI